MHRLAWPQVVRQDDAVNAAVHFAESYWWLVFIVPPVLGGALQRHHARRMAILAAKRELEDKRQEALKPAPDPQPISGCSHHLSFHNPATGACAVEDCRCQQYVGPEPLGHVFAQPLIDPAQAARSDGSG